MRGPRGYGARVGGGPSVGGSPAWTPAKLATLQFHADFANASTITTATGISALTDASKRSASVLTQATGSKQPTIDATPTGKLNGRQSALFTNASAQELRTNTGGLASGTADHSMFTVARFTASTTYRALMSYGQPNGASCLGEGGNTGGLYWAGRSGGVTPAGGILDITGAHLIMKIRSGTLTSLCLDGQLVATATDSGYSVAAGFGFTGHAAGSEPGGNIWTAGWCSSALTADERRHVETWAQATYGVHMLDELVGIGDSLTRGDGSTTLATDNYLSQLATYLPGWRYSLANTGHSGATAAQIQSDAPNVPYLTLPAFGWRNSIVCLYVGTNDVIQSIPTATTTGVLASMIASLQGQGCTVCVGTLFPWTNSWNQGLADALNNWIFANVPAANVLPFHATPEMQLSGGAYQGTYRNTTGANAGHPTTRGYGAMARDAAPVLLRLKR